MPARYLRQLTFDGLGAHVFEDDRLAARATGRVHPFDDPKYRGATILVVEQNFGCGSSREHAPQGLSRAAIRAVVGESFGEIFAGNCVAIGVPCVTVKAADAAQLRDLLADAPGLPFRLDLYAKTLQARNHLIRIELPDSARRQLVDGTWDALAALLAAGPIIEETAKRLPYLNRSMLFD